jgi:maltokinase
LSLTEAERHSLESLVQTYAARRAGWAEDPGPAELLEAELVLPGRPGMVDVVARVGARLVHVVLGLRAAGDEARFLSGSEEEVLGLHEDETGLAAAFDATRDSELAAGLLEVLTGVETDPGRVREVRTDPSSLTLAFEERVALTVFDDVTAERRRGLELFLALDDAGFNHLAAPLEVWNRLGRHLGIAQEFLAGGSTGWALAMTSVRDFYATGGAPEHAGGDFGGEALRLGIMTARMHLALDQAFGRRRGDAGAWVDAVEAELRHSAPGLLERAEVMQLLDEVRDLHAPSRAIRTHGDFQLSRVCRTEQGWYVMDFSPGGRPSTVAGIVGDGGAVGIGDELGPTSSVASDAEVAAAAGPVPTFGPSPSPAFGDEDAAEVFRSPLADVADLLWSFGRVAASVAQERDPGGREHLRDRVLAWERRNRRAFLAGYLAVPGINGLVPPSRDAVAKTATVFELARAGQMHDPTPAP